MYTIELVISNQTKLAAGRERVIEQLFLVAFVKTSGFSETF